MSESDFNGWMFLGWAGCVAAGACTGGDGVDGLSIAMRSTPFAADGRCPSGGTLLEYGVDDGEGGDGARDQVLADAEVDGSTIVCNGVTGEVGPRGFASLIATDTEIGSACADFGDRGGTRLRAGFDDGTPTGTAGNGILEAGEVDSTSVVCHGSTGPTGAEGDTGARGPTGYNALVVTDADVGTACATFGNRGGTRVRSGVDDGSGGGVGGNAVLESGEVDDTVVVCNGQTGLQGQAGDRGPQGFNALMTFDATVGTSCAAFGNQGGVRIRSGVDDGGGTPANAGNNQLDATEVDVTSFVCNGATGLKGDKGDKGDTGEMGTPTSCGPTDTGACVHRLGAGTCGMGSCVWNGNGSIGVHGLALTQVAGVTRITCGGDPCSESNDGYVVMRGVEHGELVTLRVASPAHAIEDATDIEDSPFGTWPGAWPAAAPRPFFVYAVNVADSEAAFAVSPSPTVTAVPVAAQDPGSGSMSQDTGLFFFEPGDAARAGHDAPALLIGRIRMYKDTDDDWYVAPFGTRDGLGAHMLADGVYDLPAGQRGAGVTSHFFKVSGDPALVFDQARYHYTVGTDGQCTVVADFISATYFAGAAASGPLELALPYAPVHELPLVNGNAYVNNGSNERLGIVMLSTTSAAVLIPAQNANDLRTVLQNVTTDNFYSGFNNLPGTNVGVRYAFSYRCF